MAWQTPKTNWATGDIPVADDFNRIEGNTQYLKDEVDSYKADYTLQVPFGGTTTNSGNNYSIATPAIDELVEGMAIAVKINADSTGATTLNWNGKGAKPIKKANGTDVTNLKAGGIYTFRYDGVNFILQGSDSAGDATPADVLSGKLFSNDDDTELVGTMPDRGNITYTITTQGGQYTIPAGYHSGAGKVTASFANLIASNIRDQINVGGVVGTLKEGKTGTVPINIYGIFSVNCGFRARKIACILSQFEFCIYDADNPDTADGYVRYTTSEGRKKILWGTNLGGQVVQITSTGFTMHIPVYDSGYINWFAIP